MNRDANLPFGKTWKTWKIIQEHYQLEDSAAARDLMSAQKIKLKKYTNSMKILSNISVVEVRFKKTLDEQRKIEVVQNCAGGNYAQVIVVADGIVQIPTGGACNATGLEQCKAIRKTWQITGRNNDDEDNNNNDNDSTLLETSPGAVKQKQSTNYQSKCFHCHKRVTSQHSVLTRKIMAG
jgi:hypothetical protein